MASKIIDNRVNFGSVKNPMPFPDFLDVQLKSFKDFLQLDTPPEERKNDGLYKVFSENFPITDTRNSYVLQFLDYYIDPPRYTIDECLERGLTYSVPLKAKLKLECTDPDHVDFPTVVQDVFLGPIPYMTANGTFVINGAERVVVSQLHRSPGVFFGHLDFLLVVRGHHGAQDHKDRPPALSALIDQLPRRNHQTVQALLRKRLVRSKGFQKPFA